MKHGGVFFVELGWSEIVRERDCYVGSGGKRLMVPGVGKRLLVIYF